MRQEPVSLEESFGASLAKPLMSDSASRSPKRLLLMMAAILLVMSAAFGWTTWKAHERFAEHREAWTSPQTDIPGCRDAVMAWAESCDSLDSWCQAAVPDLMRDCLAQAPRDTYCRAQGQEIKSTRFGYEACLPLHESETDRYRKRRAKKHCALAYRVVAGYCEDLAATTVVR